MTIGMVQNNNGSNVVTEIEEKSNKSNSNNTGNSDSDSDYNSTDNIHLNSSVDISNKTINTNDIITNNDNSFNNTNSTSNVNIIRNNNNCHTTDNANICNSPCTSSDSIVRSDSSLDNEETEEEDCVSGSEISEDCDDCELDGAVVLSGSGDKECPSFGNICVQNSTDVHFGNKTIYQGPVTIKQIVYAGSASENDAEEERRISDGVVPQLTYKNAGNGLAKNGFVINNNEIKAEENKVESRVNRRMYFINITYVFIGIKYFPNKRN